MLSARIELATLGLWDLRAANCANRACRNETQNKNKRKEKKNNESRFLRQPGIEPGPPRWQRGILTTELLALEQVLCLERLLGLACIYLDASVA